MSIKQDNKSPFSRRLKEARMKSKLSQKKLGILAGIDEFSASARMNQYEKGKHTPDYVTMKRLAEVMNVPISYLYEDNDEMANFVINLHKLSDADKKIIFVLINEFLSKQTIQGK